MNFRLMAVLGVLLAQGHAAGQPWTVDVYINNHDESDQLLGASKPLVTDVYRKIGVQMIWHKGGVPAGRKGFAIQTAEHAPATATREALAASELLGPGAPEITVYRDRLQTFLKLHPSLARVGASYVLAHELGHLLEGIARHSDFGIMKAHWSERDFDEMMFHRLAFAPVDIDLIQKGLAPMAVQPKPPADPRR